MTSYQPRTSYSDSIKRPACPACGTPMMLDTIEPHLPHHDLRTFECPKCGNEVSEVVKFE
jgi:hypothetical protein